MVRASVIIQVLSMVQLLPDELLLGYGRQFRQRRAGQLGPAVVNFLAIHRDRGRGGNADSNLGPFHGENSQMDVPVDHDLLSCFSCQYQHEPSPSWAIAV